MWETYLWQIWELNNINGGLRVIMHRQMIGISINQEHFGRKVRRKTLLSGKQEERRIYQPLILINLKMIGQRTQKADF